MSRRVSVVTGSRAEYGLLRWIMQEIREHPDLELQVLVTGMHLSHEFGLTVREIEADGFEIVDAVEMLVSADTPSAIAKSIGLGTIGFADSLRRLRPDILLVLGDRYEILAVAQAALVARIPIAHIHGGERTEGLIDEAIRHAVTKMSHLHFVSTAEYRRRVIQLGEQPDRVFDVGAPGLDTIRRLELLDREELEEELVSELGEPAFLVTYHPVTLEGRDPREPMSELLEALDAYPEASIVITYPNADTEGRRLVELAREFAAARPGRVLVRESLGQLRYLSAMRAADVVVGNSSSGLIEAPSLGTPTVNVGIRQQGRVRAESVIDCDEDAGSIRAAIDRALAPELQARAETVDNPYGDGRTAPRIVERLAAVEPRELVVKRFYDVPFEP